MTASESHETVEATVRRVPRFGVFMGLGVILGILGAALITWLGSYEESVALGVVYPPGQVFGFALLWTVPIGLALGGVVALILERAAARHARIVRVEHEQVETIEAPSDDA